MSSKNDDEVVTPGGRRSKSVVHRIDLARAVTGEGKVVYSTVAAEPAGMRPMLDASQEDTMTSLGEMPSANVDVPAEMLPPSGARVMASTTSNHAPPYEPAGMYPDSGMADPREYAMPSAARTAASLTSSALALTPGGYRHRSLIHQIETGHRLDFTRGRVRKMLEVFGRRGDRYDLSPE